MQYDLPRSNWVTDLDLRSNLQNDLLMSPCICSKPAWREKHDGVNIFVLALLVKQLSAKKKHFQENGHFRFDDLWSLSYWLEHKYGNILIGACFEGFRTFFFGFLLASIVPEIFGDYWNNVNILGNLTFDDPKWPLYWPEYKNEQNTFESNVE